MTGVQTCALPISFVFISHDIYFVRSVANVVFEVKNGKIRKFSGGFDYYLEKKDQEEVTIKSELRIAPHKTKQNEEKEMAKFEEKRKKEEEKKRKAHNAAIRIEITRLEKDKEKLQLENYAKARALSNPHIFRDEETAKNYGRRIKEIEKLISEIDIEIKNLEVGIL